MFFGDPRVANWRKKLNLGIDLGLVEAAKGLGSLIIEIRVAGHVRLAGGQPGAQLGVGGQVDQLARLGTVQ